MTSPERGREGVQKMAIWGDFQELTGMTGRGRGVKTFENSKIWVTSFMDVSLRQMLEKDFKICTNVKF